MVARRERRPSASCAPAAGASRSAARRSSWGSSTRRRTRSPTPASCRTSPARVERARELAAAGARIVDVGGESAFGGRPPVPADEEAARVVPVIEAVGARARRARSRSTRTSRRSPRRRSRPARTSSTTSPGCAIPSWPRSAPATGAGLVVMHTRVAPKGTLLDPGFYDDVVADVRDFLAERIAVAEAAGRAPGAAAARSRARTSPRRRRRRSRCCAGSTCCTSSGRPLLLAVSRKDFLGAITGRPPRERGAATLAAVGWAADAGAHVVRVHDVARRGGLPRRPRRPARRARCSRRTRASRPTATRTARCRRR